MSEKTDGDLPIPNVEQIVSNLRVLFERDVELLSETDRYRLGVMLQRLAHQEAQGATQADVRAERDLHRQCSLLCELYRVASVYAFSAASGFRS